MGRGGTTFANAGIGIASFLLSAVLFLELKERVAGPEQGDSSSSDTSPPVLVANWDEAVARGHHLAGNPAARVTIIELTDFECSACRSYQRTIDSLLISREGQVRVVYLPLPLEQLHRFALPAARAGECAAEDGHLYSWLRTMFAQQDSLGLKSWGTLAHLAGLPDTVRIATCANSSITPPRIRETLAFAEELGVMATPTIMVNGWRYPRPPSISQLEKIVDAAIKGPNEIAVED